MGRAGETIDTTVFATAVRIHTRFKTNVRTVIAGDNCLRAIAKKLRARSRSLVFVWIGLNNIDIAKIDMELFKSIGWIP